MTNLFQCENLGKNRFSMALRLKYVILITNYKKHLYSGCHVRCDKKLDINSCQWKKSYNLESMNFLKGLKSRVTEINAANFY